MAASSRLSEPLMKDLDPQDLQAIYNNIDDHLSFWQVLYNESHLSHGGDSSVALDQVGAISDWLKMSSAPLYATQNLGGVRGLLYRGINLVIKIFGSPQILFNRKYRDYLNELQTTLQAFNAQSATLKQMIVDNQARIRELEGDNEDLRQEVELLRKQLRNPDFPCAKDMRP